MPPHCDSLDGPVVTAAREALAREHVEAVLPYVPADAEDEIRDAFHLALKVRALGGEAVELAERWFFETTVRVHRAGEGAPFTGLKPAGLDVGPVIPVAEEALESGSPTGLADVLCDAVRGEVERRHARAMVLKDSAAAGVPQARAFVEAMLGLQVWAHGVHRKVTAEGHGHSAGAG